MSKLKIEIDNVYGSLIVGFFSLIVFLFIFLPTIETILISPESLEKYIMIRNYSLSFISCIFFVVILYILKHNFKIEKELNNSLKTKEKELKVLTNIVDKNIISTVTDINGKILEVTQSFLDIYEYSLEEVIGSSHNIIKSYKMPKEIYFDLWYNISAGNIWECELLNSSKSGKEVWIDTTIIPEYDDNNNIIKFRSISHNITDQKTANYLLEYDPLTNLPNKLSFDKLLNHAINVAKKNDTKLAIVFIDIDNFKNVNEKYGYFGGDEVLKIITKRLKSIIHNGDVLSRYSGDEFILLVENIKNNEIVKYIDDINSIISQSICMQDGHKISLSTSIGVSIYPENGEKSSDLIKNADSAMLNVKDNGKNDFKFYNDEISKFYKKRILIEHTLTKFIQNKDFYLLYQPKYDLQTKEIIGAEALIRMKDNVFYPNEFIAIAEESDKISDITKIVIEKIIKDIKLLNLNDKKDFNISINLSSKDLKDNTILNFLIDSCKENNVDHSLISIEITEYTLMKNIDHTIKILQNFRDHNIEISIDDFGTGYSSMNYLKLLPINAIKIDKSFIDNIDNNIKDKHIVKAMIDLSKALKLNIIVEGIETNSQEELLNKIGCQQGQGYLFSKPLPFDAFKEKLSN